MKRVMIIGCGISQFPAFSAAMELGYETIGIDKNKDAISVKYADFFEQCDIKDEKAALEIARKYKIDGVVVPGTDFPYTAAFIAEKMNLPGIPIDVAKLCSNKFLMRKRLQETGINVPRFKHLKSSNLFALTAKVFLTLNDELRFPLVIKPIHSMAARGVRKVENIDELVDAIKDARKYDDEFIIEEYVEGMEFSIDSFAINGEVRVFAFADRHFFLSPYFIEYGHTTPSTIKGELREYIVNEFKRAVKALGINFGSAKGDVKLTKDGVVIGEIAARMSGGFLSGWTVPLTASYRPHEDLLRLAIGDTGNLNAYDIEREREYGYATERAIMSIPGKIKDILHLEGKYHYSFLYTKNGDEVSFPVNNAKRCGSVLDFSPDRTVAIHSAEQRLKNIFLRLEPNNKLTEEFISNTKFRMFIPSEKEKDWHGFDIEEAIGFIQKITKNNSFFRDKKFWDYFYKGGIQGGVYYIDTYC